MSNARKLKGKNFGISLDLPSEILERTNKKMKQFKPAKKDNKTAFLVERSGTLEKSLRRIYFLAIQTCIFIILPRTVEQKPEC